MEKRKSARAKRDTQKQRLYAAENAARIIHEPGDKGKLADIPACQAYVRRVCRSAWARKNAKEIAAPRAVMVIGGNGNNANATRIMLTPSGRTRGVVLHELAHVIETRRNGYVTNPWHGREYAAIYLALVRRFMGRAEYLKLRAEFKARKVKYAAGRIKRAGTVVGKPDALRIWREAVTARKAASPVSRLCEVCVNAPATAYYAFRDMCDECRHAVQSQETLADGYDEREAKRIDAQELRELCDH